LCAQIGEVNIAKKLYDTVDIASPIVGLISKGTDVKLFFEICNKYGEKLPDGAPGVLVISEYSQR
jgi:hypothetical protein